MRYAAFSGANYYPGMGFEDFVSWHDNEADAWAAAIAAKEEDYSWCSVWAVSDDNAIKPVECECP